MIDAGDQVTIPLSRTKLLLLGVGAALFVALGVWLLLTADKQVRYDPLYVKAVAILAIGFFGLCGAYGVMKLFDSRPGLILDSAGLTDNSSAFAVGRVAWNEIRDIRVLSIRRQKFLALIVRDPGKYLRRGNSARQYVKTKSFEMTGSPVTIASNALSVGFDELEKLVRAYWLKYGAG
jgi:hypothetical protein